MKFQINFQTRQRLEVAFSIAQAVKQKMMDETTDRPMAASRPTLLSVSEDTVRFEGGTVVKVDLMNIGSAVVNGHRLEEWVTTGAKVRYYPYNYSSWEREEEKVSLDLGPQELKDIKSGRYGWHHPHVADKDEVVLGEFGVFFNNAAWDAVVVENHDRNNYDIHYTLCKSFPYGHNKEDREQALKEAKLYRDELLT